MLESAFAPAVTESAQIPLWIKLPFTLYVCAIVVGPQDNINWVFGPGVRPQDRLPPLLYLVLVMIFFPLAVYLPTHFVLLKLFGTTALAREP